MYLIVQIPCLNEERTLGEVIDAIPKSIQGVSKIEIVVIDDGSIDKTVETAKRHGASTILSNKRTLGLANSFRVGLEYAIEQEADILVNTDGDHQYPSDQIPALIQPIIQGTADMVIGDRQTNQINHFSTLKKIFQFIGTKLTQLATANYDVKDAASGFRSYSSQAIKELNITSDFSYVLDTLVQASRKKMVIASIPIRTNSPKRPSRLFTNMWQHIWKSGTELLRVFAYYRPFRVFTALGFVVFVLGAIPMFRFLIDYFYGDGGQGKIQSLILGSVLLSASFNLFALAIIGELMSKNRLLIERSLNRAKQT